MAGRFPPEVAVELLVACHRRCCLCHRFCGVKMELDHMVQAAEGGPDTAENAIPLCFDCHAEVHGYNDRHPRGRKFSAEELRAHKEQWLTTCRDRPEVLLSASRDSDVGPLQALMNELEFNLVVAKYPRYDQRGCRFKDDQFDRAVRQGAIWGLDASIKGSVLEAYRAMGSANVFMEAELHQHPNLAVARPVERKTQALMETIEATIKKAYDDLSGFLDPAYKDGAA